MKVVVYTRTDMINGVAYSPGEICGWPDHVADRLVAKGFAKLYGDGKVQKIDGKIPGAADFWTNTQLAEHVDKLKKEGKWTPPPPVVVKDLEVERAARERARQEMNLS